MRTGGRAGESGGVSSAMKVYSSFTYSKSPRRDGEGLRFAQEPAAVGVLEIEDRLERPVEVIREAGRLPEEILGGRPHHSPRRPSSISVRSTSNCSEHTGQATTPTASPSELIRS